MPDQPEASPKSILVLWWYPDIANLRPAIRQHLHVMDNSLQQHRIQYYRVTDKPVSRMVRWESFDVIILHTSMLCPRWNPLFPLIKQQIDWIRHSKALKIALPQDEYDHSEILDEWLQELGVSVIGSNFDERVRPLLYPLMSRTAKFIHCLTGYINEPTAGSRAGQLLPSGRRPVDIVYRAAHLPYWFGSQGQLKHRIASIVAARADELGLRCDISTRPEDTITSEAWFDFLAKSKTIIGCESGSSVLDPRGAIQAYLRWRQLKNPQMTFEEACQELPPNWDSYQFFAVGPRHFEAVMLKTCQILVEGEYDGIFQAHRHYLPLRRDFGNLDEVLHMVNDHALLEETANRAYEDIYQSGKYTYTSMAKKLDEVIAEVPSCRSVVRSTLLRAIQVVESPLHHTRTLLLFLLRLPVMLFLYSRIGLMVLRVILHTMPDILCHRHLRRALRQGWKSGGKRKILRDLFKLSMLRRLASKRTHEVPLKIHLEIEQDTIRIVSRPLQQSDITTEPVEINKAEVLEKLQSGDIQHIVWDHTRILQPIRLSKGLTRVGDRYLCPNWQYTFEALQALTRQNPQLVVFILLQSTGKEGFTRCSAPQALKGTQSNHQAAA